MRCDPNYAIGYSTERINPCDDEHTLEEKIKIVACKVITGSRVLILGLTYKENVPDTRESPVEEMIRELKEFEIDVYGYDPLLRPEEIEHFGARPVASLEEFGEPGKTGAPVDCIVINAPHALFSNLTLETVCGICNGKPIVVDVTGMLRGDDEVRDGCVYRTL
ncbi:MAG: UDP-glucose 6-dehydrogenase [Methanomicrobiales archaeon 53_19]|uniref:UDP-glucose/GDP-mannose dehydrogenase family protein n=1 Tax=Methanocalculus sp. TaxID=2004547 RepID=UPI000748D9B4|nr:UDP-glucose/GDP-mannose dehydrogenase family protein [Methanocalculus sp.]KUK68585.1 MAG: UDP-glucose 6-dehydrogenase [Methanocalculus sp. 52_23]KUL00783.1 MAG: UDP-glucose 6-dehydrogenase [Methanomicrobiales archaeon 53_19]HIJ05899.1 hypothetical protein [Methanocalculus sp.]